jgi:predicted GIY-YIG superfamily endonuclease
MIIYKITNLINQKIYIGQTTGSIQERWEAHCNPKGDCRKLRNAIKSHGKNMGLYSQ